MKDVRDWEPTERDSVALLWARRRQSHRHAMFDITADAKVRAESI